MSDLNEWRLEYGDTVLNFGTLATDYPFRVQIDHGDIGGSTQDQDHPTADGRVMGKDKLSGFTLTMDMQLLPEFPLPAKPWVAPLDLFSSFRAAWRADEVRRNPGVYATLTNMDRNRQVYGRPRKCTPALDRLRKGRVQFLTTFDTNSPDWYDSTEKLSILTPAPVGSGFLVPLTVPITVAGASVETNAVTNNGDLVAWPVIKFHGPGSGLGITMYDGVTPLWTQSVFGPLKYDEVLTLDTRPWNRSATLNGKPANGRIRGNRIEDLAIPLGTNDVSFKVQDPTGTAFAEIRWHDAYASM